MGNDAVRPPRNLRALCNELTSSQGTKSATQSTMTLKDSRVLLMTVEDELKDAVFYLNLYE